MQLTQIIKNRRSVRSYLSKKVSPALIRKIIQAGIWAPSGLNNQPWKFRVVKDPGFKKQLAECTKFSHVIEQAPAAICVFLDKELSYDREKDIMAVGACIQNMLLKALDLGISTCWLGEILNHKRKVHSLLKTGKKLELMAVIAVGFKAGKKPSGKRKPLDRFITKK